MKIPLPGPMRVRWPNLPHTVAQRFTTPRIISGLILIIRSAMLAVGQGWRITQPGSTSMPIPAKNSVTSKDLSGEMSARICTANGEPANRRPARKARKGTHPRGMGRPGRTEGNYDGHRVGS